MNKKGWQVPRKRFGQHFLQDERVISAILQAMHLKREDKVVEIGPGRGALTWPLLKQLSQLYVIEYDRDICAVWRQHAIPALTLIEADALTVDFSAWGAGVRVVGNLPYNISTAILIHLLDATQVIQDIHVMLQKEVADRLLAPVGCKAYSRFSVMMQTYFEGVGLLDVPPEAFNPPPKVWSSVVRLTPKRPVPTVDRVALERLLLAAFSMRRKTLFNNLSGIKK